MEIKNLFKKLKLMRYHAYDLGEGIYRVTQQKSKGLFTSDNNFGLMNFDGELLQDFLYDCIINVGNYILACRYKDFANYRNCDIIDKNNNKKIVEHVDVDFAYDSRLILTNRDGKCALVKTNKEVLQEPEFIYDKLIEIYGIEKSYFIAKKDGKYGLLENGEVLWPFEYDFIIKSIDSKSISAQKNNQIETYNLNGENDRPEKINQESFDAIDKEEFSNGFRKVFKDGKVGLIDLYRKKFVPCKYDDIKKFIIFHDSTRPISSVLYEHKITNLAIVKLNDKFGCINKEGAEVIPCICDYIRIGYNNIDVRFSFDASYSTSFTFDKRSFKDTLEKILAMPEVQEMEETQNFLKNKKVEEEKLEEKDI